DRGWVLERWVGNEIKGEADAARAKRERYNKSILDFVTEDANRLRGELGATDRRKLGEYLAAIREIEIRISKHYKDVPDNVRGVAKPTGIPKEYEQHMRLLGDLLVLAFQGDMTRVATFVFANEGSNRSYRQIGVPDGHHDLSHHGNNKEKLAKIRKINRFHMTQFAYFLEKLK